MNNKLPKVKSEVAFSVEHSLNSFQSDVKTVKSELRNIAETNPVIAEFIYKFSKLSEDRLGCALSGILVYKLLASQFEADRMKEEIKLV